MASPFLIADENLRKSALEVVLDSGRGRAANASAIRNLRDYVAQCGVRCDVVSSRADSIDTPVVLVVSPGRMCLVMMGMPTSQIESDNYAALLRQLAAHYQAEGILFFQALTEMTDKARQSIFTAAEFRRITQLVYLERDTRHPWIDPPEAADATWISFSDSTAGLFSSTIRATYCDTRDCPELSERRSDADILAAHRASGEFSAQRWELAQVRGEIAGCILLNRVVATEAFEVAYMGVVPAFRGRGVGAILLRRGLMKARTEGARLLTLAVDARNSPARNLYDKMGFRAIASRQAYLRFLNEDQPTFHKMRGADCG